MSNQGRERNGSNGGSAGRALVVSHEASRTGAPKVARAVIEALARVGYDTGVVHRWGGPFEAELNAAAQHHVLEPFRRSRALLRRYRQTRRWAVAIETYAASSVVRREKPDLVWCNSSLASCYIKPCQRAGIPVVLHVHEMATLSAPILARYKLVGTPHSFAGVELVACSTAAADDLAVTTGVDREFIRVLPSPVDTTAIRASGAGIAADPEFVTIAGCGTANATKGVDYFIKISTALAHEPSVNYRFRWIGRCDSLGTQSKGFVDFVGEVDDPIPLLAAADIVLMPSRLDAFPLAVLESMALSKPIIGFDVGGIREQLGDAGIVVEPGDTVSMIEAIHKLAGDPELRTRLGEAAEKRVRMRWDIKGFQTTVAAIASIVTSSKPWVGND